MTPQDQPPEAPGSPQEGRPVREAQDQGPPGPDATWPVLGGHPGPGGGQFSRDGVQKAVRAYLGTPYRHLGRGKRGLDCIGLVASVARDVGYPNVDEHDPRVYSRMPDGRLLLERCERSLERVAGRGPAPGDVGVFWFNLRSLPTHLAVFCEHPAVPGLLSLVHTYASSARVVEHAFDDRWRAQLSAVYCFRGLEEPSWPS